MEKKATIVSLEKRSLTNEKTGEVTPMCVVTYLTSREEEEDSCGNDVRTAWIKADNYDKLKAYIHKPNVELSYTTKVVDNKDKYILQKFGSIALR